MPRRIHASQSDEDPTKRSFKANLDDDIAFTPLSSENEEVEDEEGNLHESEEEEGEDLFDPVAMRRDYEPDEELDRYEPDMLDDDSSIAPMDLSERHRAEQELELRDRIESHLHGEGRSHSAFVPDFGSPRSDYDEENERLWELIRKRRESFRDRATTMTVIPAQQAEQAKEELPYCQNQFSWTKRVEEILGVVLTGFICLYKKAKRLEFGLPVTSESQIESTSDDRDSTYLNKISEMVHNDQSSIIVLWDDLRQYCPKLCDWIYHVPLNSLKILDVVVTKITQERFPKLYSNRKVACRLKDYSAVDTLRSLNTESLHRLICVRGVVIRASNIIPRLSSIYFKCGRCQCTANGPYEYYEGDFVKLRPVCEDCQSTGPFTISRERTIYENYQKLTIQQQPNQVTPGHLPRQKEAVVLGDLVDSVRPGEEVVITGIYQTKPDARLNAMSGFPILASYILVNNIDKNRDLQIETITEDDKEIFHKLSKHPRIREKIIDSIAPSLWGHRHIKAALAYSMFGGLIRHTDSGHTIRGDINVLILGDPGMGKSQFLKYVEKTFDRTIYTTGKGASGVGLTASVRRDPVSREWCLEGGGLVLADEGICLIDEFDKMNDQDRVSIHEAMEQQTISISKAGIVATLRARCAIIAAANPVFGRYNSSLTFSDNVNLLSPILSRFDILAIVKDQANATQDEHLAQYVVRTHMKSHCENKDILTSERVAEEEESDLEDISLKAKWVTNSGKIPQSVLKKYICYSRMNCFPEFRAQDEAKLAKFYSEIREASMTGGGMPMTVRHFESIMRIAVANAKMRLSSTVERSDIDFAISIMLESFIQSQKHAVAVSLCKRFGKYYALASSPEEFLESVLIDLFSRKVRDALRAHFKGVIPSSLELEDMQILNNAKVSLAEWTTVVRALYNVPDVAVTKYMNTARFKTQYLVERSGQDKENIFILSRSRREAVSA